MDLLRGVKECEVVENMVKKYLYKSHGKFRLALIDIKHSNAITGRLIPVSYNIVHME